jgi:hypothetical protein
MLYLYLAYTLSSLVVNSRFGIQFCFELFQFIFDNVSGDFTVWVFEVPEHPNPCHTSGHTSWFFTLFNKFDTETALFDIAFLLNDSDIIRTSSNAIFTANALILIHQNYSIFSLMRGSGGTDLHTGSIIAMLALDRQEFTGIVWEVPVFPFFEMIIGLFFLKAILVMTGNTTGVTPYTLCFIDHHSITSHCFLSHLSLIFLLTPSLSPQG